MAERSPRHIRLEEEIGGDQEGTTDFVFCRIGESTPLKASDSQFDLKDPPSRPLAVSERFRVIFLAHSEGFLVAKTKDVIGLGKLIKENGKGPCIENSSIVDVKIGKVSLLALSNDSSVLAAVVGSEIQFFYVPSLVNNKEDKPSFLCSMRDSRTIKDFKWQKKSQKSYVVLASDGLLCYGRIKEPLKAAMENIDAVDWSADGDFIAVAKKSSVSIFSSDFKEKICMSLFVQSWSDAECESVRVDSVEWIHDDSIIIGSIRVNADGSEEGYMVQVISSGAKKFTESSCNPVVISFPCLFEGILDDVLPAGAGPYLLLSYLDRWGLLLTSNKKNIDQHVVLVKDTMDEYYRREVSWLEFQNDKYKPSIGLQENGEDNLILGFGIDKISLYEKVEVQVDTEFKELSPYCILFCLTCEGKLAMFHVARISDTSDLPQPSIPPMDVPLEDELFSNTSKIKNGTDDLIPIDRSKQISYESASFPEGDELKDGGNKNLPEFPRVNTQLGKGDERGGVSFHRQSIGYPQQTTQLSTNLSSKNGPDSVIDRTSTAAETVSSSRTQVQVPLLVGNMSSETAATKKNEAKGLVKGVGQVAVPTSSFQSGGFFSSRSINTNSSSLASGTIFSDSSDKLPSGLGQTPVSSRSSISFNLPSVSAPILKGTGGPPSMILSSSKDARSEAQTTFLNKSSNAEAAAATSFSSQESSGIGKITFSKQQPSFSNLRTSKQLQMSDSEPELVKQYNNVKEMARELDNMLELIEQEGGFRDACTIFQQSAVLVLEEGLKNLSETLKIRKRYAEDALMEVQNLQRKMLQVSAKQVYMADIVKQASSTQYWDMWSRQKLSPEVEQKQQNIRKAHQNLTNQLIQLEKHFNNVEISKFGGSDTISAGQRAFHNNLRQSRHSQSLHSVCNTLNSQLAAAEQLSERLSKQMDLLKLNDTSTRRTGVAKELLESIGLAGEDITLKSPIGKNAFHTPDSMKRISFIDTSSEGRLTRASTSALSNIEPGTTRRRRESLEKSRTCFEPSKTVVKRMTQQESVKIDVGNPFQTAKKEFDSKLEMYAIIQQKATGNSSSSTDSISKVQPEGYAVSKDVYVKPSKQASNLPTSSVFKWANEPSGIPQTLVSKPYPVEDGKKIVIPTSVTSPQKSSLYGSGSSQIPELISRPMEGLPKSTMTSTPSLFNRTSNVPKESIVPMKSVSPLPTVPNLQMEAPKPVTTSLNLVSDLSATKSTSTVEKEQGNKQSDPKPSGEGWTLKLPGSILQSAASPQKSSALSTKSNAFYFSTMSTSTSSDVGQRNHTEKTTNNEQFSVSAPNLQTKMVASQIPSSTFALSAPSASGSSAFTMPSLPTFGGSSPFQAKTVGETRLAHSASVSTSTSALFTSSSQSQPLGSKTDPPLTASEGFQFSLSQPIEVNSKSEPTIPQASSHDQATSKIEPLTVPANMGLTGSSMTKEASSVPMVGNLIPASTTRPEEGSAVEHLAITKATENNNQLDANSIQEEEMEEEVSDASNELNLGALSGFGLGPSSFSSTPKPNPFGSNFLVGNASTVGSAPALTTQPGQLFRPPSFSLPTAKNVSPSLSVSPTGISSGITNAYSGFGKPSQIGAAQPALGSVLSSNTNALSGFGQPSQIGAAQQALGSVLGTFGESRQLGPGGFGGGFANVGTSGGASSGFSGNIAGGGFAALASQGGGFAGATGGGFAAAGFGTGGFAGASAGGFAAAASSTSGFAAAASSGSGGFAGAGTGGGFTSLNPTIGGFGGATSQGSGFGGTSFGGGFGAFNSTQGGAFSAFGGSGSTGTGRPPAELFTQMRR
ncbi:nuclear pore complex protein NUP214-like isoform X1 [Zingiber officinale]|uniref:nuclear pore complex protein NUP214-like isoform X1 n=3 Tax=Zingiber officinale TaxID=94328 RepID=UPI001C4D583C|nr:nuclear pore complex protein NUP214-like isoform X1 [Zingiber officinale]XP_042380623.1 nuclear pore complex protein NUP214-like isoform X1 [Zingiber officinale]XP_042380630.1 nuclear pore complex protein NUP214-like isoform X1 [Zingiber officinale]XP_042380637.1 nuclear pore complex protein NUP214-like isoform X1 [Zingiber officinale]XP_042380645.1 nuclear pore complex protein NUP214-like isoform X1 [Zingiber officinale]